MSIFEGAGVALVTPMKEDGSVNYDKLEELIEQQIEGGTDAIIIAGTTGESATLSMEEHHEVIKAAVSFTKHRIPLWPVPAVTRPIRPSSLQRRLRKREPRRRCW